MFEQIQYLFESLFDPRVATRPSNRCLKPRVRIG